jgi:hypothetical protein
MSKNRNRSSGAYIFGGATCALTRDARAEAGGIRMIETPIGWTVEFKINPGKTEAFGKIAEEAAAAMEKTEPGTLAFRWFLSADHSRAIVHVWMTGQEAAITHATGVGPQKHLPRLLEIATIERFDVFGTPNDKLAKILENFPVSSRNGPFAGFWRNVR